MLSKDSTRNKHVVNAALCLHHRIGNAHTQREKHTEKTQSARQVGETTISVESLHGKLWLLDGQIIPKLQ